MIKAQSGEALHTQTGLIQHRIVNVSRVGRVMVSDSVKSCNVAGSAI